MRNRHLDRIRTRWKRLFLDIYLSGLILLGEFRSKRARGRVHWIGKRSRLQRPERAFIVLMFAIAITLLEPYEYAVWATVIGGFLAIAIPFLSIRYLVRAHLVK